MPRLEPDKYDLHTVATSVLAASVGMLAGHSITPETSSLVGVIGAAALLAGSRLVVNRITPAPDQPKTRFHPPNMRLLSLALLAWSLLVLLVFVNALAAALMALALPILWARARRADRSGSRVGQFLESCLVALPALVGGATERGIAIPALIVAALLLYWSMTFAWTQDLLSMITSGTSDDSDANAIAFARRQLAMRLLQLTIISFLPALLLPLAAGDGHLEIAYLLAAFSLTISLVLVGIRPALRGGSLRRGRLTDVLNLHPMLLMSALILEWIL